MKGGARLTSHNSNMFYFFPYLWEVTFSNWVARPPGSNHFSLELFSNKMRGIFIGPRVVHVFFSMVVIAWVRGIGLKLKSILAFGADHLGISPSW